MNLNRALLKSQLMAKDLEQGALTPQTYLMGLKLVKLLVCSFNKLLVRTTDTCLQALVRW